MDQVVMERKDVPLQDRWNVEALYRGWEVWEEDFRRFVKPGAGGLFPKLSSEGFDLRQPVEVRRLLDETMQTERELSKIYTYAHLRHDEEVSEETAKKAHSGALGLFHSFKEETSWMEPALLGLEQDLLHRFLSEEVLKEYRVYLNRLIRLKPHVLGSEEERILAFSGKALDAVRSAFSSLNNADLRFPPCENEKGESCELTHGTYLLYLRGKDRVLRKNAFLNLHNTFLQYENTICELIQGQVSGHLFYAKSRKYASCLEAALYPHQVEESVYLSLIRAVRNRLSFLHEYMILRKKLLGIDELHCYDLHVPLIKEVDLSLSYEEAVEVVLESVSVLGSEYQTVLRKGLSEDRWVDRYENKKKRSGAYSSGCYDGMPYILLNYHGTFHDMMTLTHEAGHSMHTYLSSKNQTYQDHQYPIFLAEVASTFHEELLFRYLLKRAQTKEEKAYLISQKIDDIRGTLFRQTLFAEFELKMHAYAEQGIPLTPALLKEEYGRLNAEYYGEGLVLDQQVLSEWSRIPHFYSDFYVYQYATGLSAAHALAQKVADGKLPKEKVLEFLSSGGSLDPLATLERAGVNMRTSEPVDVLLCYFRDLVEQLREISKEL